jgi:hypothetical protein
MLKHPQEYETQKSTNNTSRGHCAMNRFFDSLSGSIYRGDTPATTEDITIINGLQNPPLVPVTANDIYVRKCRLVGDSINCHFGRFHTEDLPDLLRKVQGVSCLIGHRKDMAGIARFFDGKVETHFARTIPTGRLEEMRFIVPKLYWMKSHSRAEDIRVNIDGGIYHQVSISWYYERPVCGLCSKDIRQCNHIPGRMYNGELCFFWYEGIGDVLEGSIVYAGGHPGTGFALNDVIPDAGAYQAVVYKVSAEGRLHKEDILPYLQNIDSGCIYVIGDLASKGWTDSGIDVIADSFASDHIGELLPTYLAGRLILHTTFPAPGPCIKVNTGAVLEIEHIPGRNPVRENGKSVRDSSPSTRGGKEHPLRPNEQNLDTAIPLSASTDSPDKQELGAVPEENEKRVPFEIEFVDYQEQCQISSQMLSADKINWESGALMAMPHYDGIPVFITVGQSKTDPRVLGAENNCNTHPVKQVLFTIPSAYESISEVLRNGLIGIARELMNHNTDNYQLSGEIVIYRGHSRIDIGAFISSATGNASQSIELKYGKWGSVGDISPSTRGGKVGRLRFVIKVSDYYDPESAHSMTREERMKRFSELFNTFELVQRVPFVVAGNNTVLERIVKTLSTRHGVDIIPNNAHYGDESRQVFLPRQFYEASSVGDRSPSTRGEEVSQKNQNQSEFVLEEDPDNPDTLLVLRLQWNILNEAFQLGRDGFEKVSKGRLSKGSWIDAEQEKRERKPTALDSGSMTILEWGDYRRCGAFAGKVLYGVYVFRRVETGQTQAWYITKQ